MCVDVEVVLESNETKRTTSGLAHSRTNQPNHTNRHTDTHNTHIQIIFFCHSLTLLIL